MAVLAGGLATRLGDLTKNTPKSLVQVSGRPFLAWQLELFASAGISDVVLCVGHYGEQIEAWVARYGPTGMQVRFSYDGAERLGTGGALKKALGILGEVFLVTYGDSYLPCDYRSIAGEFIQLQAECDVNRRPLGLMTVYENADQFDRSNILFRDGGIQRYDKLNRTPEMRHIDWGLSVLTPDAFASFPEDNPFDLADVFQWLLAHRRLAGLEVRERFYEVGSHSGLQEFLCAFGTRA